ncbi:MAG: hypothetical protein PVH88_02490 [Ignavibacteria bacterium]|jgi:hypothetical protein
MTIFILQKLYYIPLLQAINDFETPITACFVAVYIAPPTKPFLPANEDILITDPHFLSIK